MRKFGRAIGVMALTGVIGIAGILQLDATAQEGALPRGVSIEIIASGQYDTAPEAPGLLELVRDTFEPGAELHYPEVDPTMGLLIIEAGELTLVVSADINVTHAAEAGTPTSSGSQEGVAAGTAVVLGVGDSALLPSGSGATFRNDGDERQVISGAHLAPLSALD